MALGWAKGCSLVLVSHSKVLVTELQDTVLGWALWFLAATVGEKDGLQCVVSA